MEQDTSPQPTNPQPTSPQPIDDAVLCNFKLQYRVPPETALVYTPVNADWPVDSAVAFEANGKRYAIQKLPYDYLLYIEEH